MAHDPLPVSSEPPRPLEVVRSGYVSFKKDAFASWLWRAKYLVLRDQNLTIHKNEKAPAQITVPLDELRKLERTERKPHGLLIEANGKRYFLNLKSDAELFDWQDDIYNRSPLSGVSNPTDFVHHTHVGIDNSSSGFSGLPENWSEHLNRPIPAR
ncbi:hypothetical protein PENSPDRAFT_760269 [Peniophora sp. CONT]|nr:hypothetical protein PENSPDRAFT_760269 [Peniophora sp. CONT]